MSSMPFRRKFICVVAVLVLPAGLHSQNSQPATDQGWVDLYEAHPDDEMPYRLLRPYGFDPKKEYPVIVSLHGGAGRGADNRKQLRVWNHLLADEQRRRKFPSYILAPQSPRLWDSEHLAKIKVIVVSLPAVDTDRIYLLGHSMGAHGSFILLQLDPGYFAAAAPSAGTGLPDTEPFITAATIKDVPIWAFHGDADNVCPYEREDQLFQEMKALGGNFKLTTWAGDGHGVAAKMITGAENGKTRCASDRCNPNPDMLTWLFAQSLRDRRYAEAASPTESRRSSASNFTAQ